MKTWQQVLAQQMKPLIIRIGLIKGSFVEPILAAKFSYLLFVDIVGIQKKTGSRPGISNIRSLN